MTGHGASRGTVLVTGANGFIGRDLVGRLARAGWQVRAAARVPHDIPELPDIERVRLPNLEVPVDWLPLLEGVTHVVHLAGIAHATRAIPEATYHAVNAEAVRTLAEASRAAGIARLVMVSSIRAQCGASAEGIVDERCGDHPVDAYGRAKLAGERHLAEVLAGSSTDWCVLRPVLVYGPGVKGNMAALLRLARTRWPLPLGGLTAHRSLLGHANLEAAIGHALEHPAAAGGVFLLADPEPLTVPEIVAALRGGLGRSPGLLTVPLAPVRIAATLVGRGAAWQRIGGDLVVSTAELEASGWRPVETAAAGLGRWMRESARGPSRTAPV